MMVTTSGDRWNGHLSGGFGSAHPAKPRADRYLNRHGYLTAWTGGENREHASFSKMLSGDELKFEQVKYKPLSYRKQHVKWNYADAEYDTLQLVE